MKDKHSNSNKHRTCWKIALHQAALLLLLPPPLLLPFHRLLLLLLLLLGTLAHRLPPQQ